MLKEIRRYLTDEITLLEFRIAMARASVGGAADAATEQIRNARYV